MVKFTLNPADIIKKCKCWFYDITPIWKYVMGIFTVAPCIS